jgi:LuxR family maltose regulon positive regulatory protein
VQQTTSHVQGGWLYPSERGADPIHVGSIAWFAWLEHHHTFQFADRLGGFSAYKSETDPNTLHWQASSLRHGQLMRLDLGPSRALTLERLQAAAQRLAGEPASIEPDEGGQATSAASIPDAPRTAASGSIPSSLIGTKLYRPRRSNDVIPRSRLLEHLNAGLSGKVSLVCAPAGCGKTTLVVQWLQTINRQVAWLSLDEHDNELPVFVHGLTAALQSVWREACPATTSLLSAPYFPGPESVASLLSHELADVPDEVVLVLDDYHLIHSSEVHALLEGLIEHLPAQVHLVLAARFDPPLPLIRWLARGDLQEVRSTDLRFTLEETQAFLTGVLGNGPLSPTLFL